MAAAPMPAETTVRGHSAVPASGGMPATVLRQKRNRGQRGQKNDERRK